MIRPRRKITHILRLAAERVSPDPVAEYVDRDLSRWRVYEFDTPMTGAAASAFQEALGGESVRYTSPEGRSIRLEVSGDREALERTFSEPYGRRWR